MGSFFYRNLATDAPATPRSHTTLPLSLTTCDALLPWRGPATAAFEEKLSNDALRPPRDVELGSFVLTGDLRDESLGSVIISCDRSPSRPPKMPLTIRLRGEKNPPLSASAEGCASSFGKATCLLGGGGSTPIRSSHK